MNFKMKLIHAGMFAAMTATSSGAMAAVFNDFGVTEGNVPGTFTSNITADKIIGNYVEVVTFGAGTFTTSIKWQAADFIGNDGNDPVSSFLGSPPIVIPDVGTYYPGYGLYALFQSSGTFNTVAGVTTFTFDPVGDLSVWLDPDQDTTLVAPGDGSSPWTQGGTVGDDIEIANGTVVGGTGTLNPFLATCGPSVLNPGGSGINCGSFGVNTTFLLTAAGSNYFTSPVPFYNLAFDSGQFNTFELTGTQTINGSLDVVFGNAVPEPSSIALMGLGLMGLGLALRRRKQA